MSAAGIDRVPRLRSETRYRLVDGQAVVIVQDTGEALVLNEVGSRILELVDGRRSVREIVARLLEEYDVDAGELRGDVEAYLGELLAADVVRIDEPAASDD